MAYIVQTGKINQPRRKADSTLTIPFATFLAADPKVYMQLSEWAFGDTHVKMVLVKPEDWDEFIHQEAHKLLQAQQDGDTQD